MGDGKYLYFGFGLISIFLIIGVVAIANMASISPTNSSNQDAKITIELYGPNDTKEISYFTSQEKLFSEKTVTLNFSSAKKGVQFYDNGYNCEISCKKSERFNGN